MKKKLLLSAVALAISIGYASAADYVAQELDGHYIRITNKVNTSSHISTSGDHLATTTSTAPDITIWHVEYDAEQDGIILSQNGTYMGCIPATVDGSYNRDIPAVTSKDQAGRYRFYQFAENNYCLTTTKLDNGNNNPHIGEFGVAGDDYGFWANGGNAQGHINRWGTGAGTAHWTYTLVDFSPVNGSTLNGKYITLANYNGNTIMYHTGTNLNAKLTPDQLKSTWYVAYNAENRTISLQACDGTNRYISWCPSRNNNIWTTVEEKDVDNIGEFYVLRRADDEYLFGSTHWANGTATNFLVNFTSDNDNARFFMHSNCGTNAPTQSGNWGVVRWNAGTTANSTSWHMSFTEFSAEEIKQLLAPHLTYSGLILTQEEVNQIINNVYASLDLTQGNAFANVVNAFNHAIYAAEKQKSDYENKWFTLVAGKTQFGRTKTMYYNEADNKLMWGNNQEALNYLWKLIPVEDKPGHYTMINARSLIYPQAQTSSNTAVLGTITPTEVTIAAFDGHDDGAVHIRVVGSNVDLHCLGHGNGNASNNYSDVICIYNGNWGDASSWYIEEATDADVATRYHNAYNELNKLFIDYYPESVKQAFASEESTPKQLEAAWAEVLNLENNWYTLVAGKTEFGRTKSMYYDSADNQLKWGNNQEALNYLWKLIPVEGQIGRFQMVNAQSLIYPEASTDQSAPVHGTATPTVVTITSYNDATHNDNAVHIRVVGAGSNWDLHCNNHGSGSSTNTYGSNIVVWNDSYGSASSWYLEMASPGDIAARYHSAFNQLRASYYPETLHATFSNPLATVKQLENAWQQIIDYNTENAGSLGAPSETPELVTRYRQITSVDEIKDGMQIVVRSVSNHPASKDLYFTHITYNDTPATRFFPSEGIEDINSIIWDVEFATEHKPNNQSSVGFYLKDPSNGKYFTARHTGSEVPEAFTTRNVWNYVLGTYLQETSDVHCSIAIQPVTKAEVANCGQVFNIHINSNGEESADYNTRLGHAYLTNGDGELCAGRDGNYYTNASNCGGGVNGAVTSYYVLYAVEHEQAFYADKTAEAVALRPYSFGNNPGQVINPELESIEASIASIADNYLTYNESALLDALFAFKGITLPEYNIEEFVLNPITTDRYIRIIGNTATPHYLTAPSSGNNNFSVDYTNNAIFFYGGRRLLSYTQGAALKSTDVNGGFLRNRTTVDEHEVENPGSVIDIVAAPASDDNPIQTTGRFFVYFEDQHRTMFNGEGSNGRGGVYDPNAIDGAGKQTTTNGVNKYYAFKIEYVNELPVQIHSDGIGSLYCGMNVRVPEDPGYVVYVASINEYTDTEGYQQQDLVTTIANAGTVIPAYTPILIQGEAGTTVQVPVTADAANYNVTAHSKIKSHLLVKNATPDADHVLVVKKEVAADAQTMNVRRRTGSEVTTPVQFHVVGEDETVPAGSVAIMVHQENNHLENGVFTASLGGSTGTTGIDEVVGKADAAATVVYDLLGRRLAAPVKGFNIINGKKVIR